MRKKGENKSYETLLSPLIPIKLRSFEEIALNLKDVLARFQTSAPIVPSLVDSLENPIRNFAEKLIASDVLKKANNTYKLSQMDFTDQNIQK